MILPKHKSNIFEKTKNIISSLLHNCIIMCYFITILNLDILYLQHSHTILDKCKVKQEFQSELLKRKKKNSRSSSYQGDNLAEP